MVATDVASRGIGMIFETPPPSFPPPLLCAREQMLFSQRFAGPDRISCLNYGVCWFSPMRTLISGCSNIVEVS